jgi:cell division protein FtsZ
VEPVNNSASEDKPEMKMVFKEDATPAVPEQPQQPAQPVQQQQPQQLVPQQEEPNDEQKRKQLERVAKLRSISFNVKNMDNNQEIENVPAYLRRNVDLDNGSGSAEQFYSNYTVGSDQDNKAEINTINTFLDGKKPD